MAKGKGKGKKAASEDTRKIDKPEEEEVATLDEVEEVAPPKPRAASDPDVIALKRQLAAALERIDELEGKRPAKPVPAISDKELGTAVGKAADLLEQRNAKLAEAADAREAKDRTKEKAALKDAEVLELSALPYCAKAACVDVKDIICQSRRVKSGAIERFNYAVNVRNGLLRIVLANGSRLKIDIADLDRAKWDYVHDNGGKVTGTNKRPARWQGRPQEDILRG
jgi:hypothetical protein